MTSVQPAGAPLTSPEAGSSRLSKDDSRDDIPTTRQQADNLSTEIRRLWTSLGAILDRHEDMICKRWAKKAIKKRLNTILEAWSYETMPETRQFDFWNTTEIPKTDSERRAYSMKNRYHYLMPYINQEDLCKPHILPLLLKSRGRHLPSDFAGADAGRFKVASNFGYVVTEYHRGFTMRLNGFTKDDFHKYGEIVSWKTEGAADDLITSKQFDTGYGMIVLEVQQMLLKFLVKCCRHILHDLGDDWITNYPVVLPKLHPITTGSSNDSLTKLAEEAPYRVPAKLNLEAIESLLSARSAAAKDRLWQMREDPLYFADQITEATGHRHEFTSKVTPGARKMDRQLAARRDKLWGTVLQDVVNKAYFDIEMFTELKRLAREVCHLRSKHASAISPNEDLPDEYLQALLKLRYILIMVANLSLAHLRVALVTSATLTEESLGSFVDFADPQLLAKLSAKQGLGRSETESRLDQWVEFLMNPERKGLRHLGLPLVVEFMGIILQKGKEVGDRVPSHVEEYIGDLSILSQCIEQLDLYHPWSGSFRIKTLEGGDLFHPWDDPTDREKWGELELLRRYFQSQHGAKTLVLPNKNAEGDFHKAWMTASKPWADRTVLLTKSMSVDKHVPLLKLFTRPVRYPIDKARTEENTKALRVAESNLDALWASIDDILLGSVPQSSTTRFLQRTPEWVQPEAVSSKQQLKAIKDVKFNDMPRLQETSTSHFQHFLASDEIQRTPPKIKTRGTAASTDTLLKAPELPLIPPAQPLVIPVDRIPLRVFGIIFFTPNISGTPGEIAWTHFIRAMTEAGFRARELYGSVWQFQPRELHFKRSILFHEPHPRGKIPYLVARHIGRRLTRAYGWNSSTFVPKVKM